MSTVTAFILRFFIAFTPILLSFLIFLNFHTYTKLELTLMALLVGGVPWLFYELLQHVDHQQKSNKALLRFCTSLDQMFSSVANLEQKTYFAPQEMIAEMKMMQNLMSQLLAEKTNLNSSDPSYADVQEESARFADGESEMDDVSVDKCETVSSPPQPLKREVLLEIIENALTNDKVEMLVQPIVSLPQRKARHFECFARIREGDGTIYTPDHFLALAEEENLIRLVDNAMLFRCIQMTRASVQKKFDVNFFCNVSKHTLSDRFFFESLSEFLEANRSIARHMVLEFHEQAILQHLPTIEPYLNKLNLFGCRFSMDQVSRVDHDVKHLSDLHFKFIKFNSDVLLSVLKEEGGHLQIESFKKKCDAQNMDIIISHVEEESALVLLNDFHFDYGQGFLFGCPILSKK